MLRLTLAAVAAFFVLASPADAAKCGRLDRSTGKITTITCSAETGMAVKRDRRHFREKRKARRGLVSDRVPARVAVVVVDQTDNDGRIIAGSAAAEPVRLARHSPATLDRDGSMVDPQTLPHPTGCPRRSFCGCGAAVRVFGSPIRSLWLAANWLKYPRAAPAPGMVAARRGHVFVIEQVLGGNRVLAYDANSGRGKTRLHVRSLAGFSVRNPRAT